MAHTNVHGARGCGRLCSSEVEAITEKAFQKHRLNRQLLSLQHCWPRKQTSIRKTESIEQSRADTAPWLLTALKQARKYMGVTENMFCRGSELVMGRSKACACRYNSKIEMLAISVHEEASLDVCTWRHVSMLCKTFASMLLLQARLTL